MTEITLPLRGGCQCGQLRYEIKEAPSTLYCCHCTECQAQTASAFGTSIRVAGTAVSLSGATGKYVRDGGKPTEVECLFCPECGTRVLHRRDAVAANVSIKGGSLDEGHGLLPIGHIWTGSKQAWVTFPENSLNYSSQPDDGYAALIERFAQEFKFVR